MAFKQSLVPITPLELADFSGGLTDNYFDSGPNRYAAADNFLIMVDRKLLERPGTIPFDFYNYLMPGATRRVDALFTYINETKICVNQGRDIFVLPDVYTGSQALWQRVVGPSGNEAIGAGGAYSLVTMDEYNHQMMFGSDAFAIPSIMYRDKSLQHQVITAGLPRVTIPNAWNDVTLLAACLVNANQLRQAMINHIEDQGSSQPANWTSATTAAHAYVDKWSLGYLTAVTWVNITDPEYPGPVPNPTPAPAATNIPTLLTLVGALNTAYTDHVTRPNSYTYYHWEYTWIDGATVLQGGPQPLLQNNALPTTLYQCAGMLDDLYQKLYWHLYAVNTHAGLNNVTKMALYDYTSVISKIGAVNYSTGTNLYPTINAPVVTPFIQDYLDYVNGLAAIYNIHIGGGGGVQNATGLSNTSWSLSNGTLQHAQPDAYDEITLPLATTLDQAYLMIYWIRQLYTQHQGDSNGATFALVSLTWTTGSTATVNSGGTPIKGDVFRSPVPGTYSWAGAAGDRSVAYVSSYVSTTVTFDRAWHASGSTANFQMGSSGTSRGVYFHGLVDLVSSGEYTATGLYTAPEGENLVSAITSVGTDMVSWNGFAQEAMYCLLTHMTNPNTHYQVYSGANVIASFNPTSTPGVDQWYVPTISNIAYAFTNYYQYTVEPNGVQYVFEGNPVYSASIETLEPYPVGYTVPTVNAAFYASTLINVQRYIPTTDIPAVINDLSTNYDTANIMVRVYRTTNGGTTFYLDQALPNGTLSFNDDQNSLVPPAGQNYLIDNEVLYTSGGVVGNDQPPQCKCLHVLDGVAYYGNLLVAGQYLPNQILQGLVGNLGSAPATFTDTFQDEVVAISSARSVVVVFCKDSIYRLAGSFQSNGQGQLIHERISDRIGCIGPHSVVRTEIGLFFGGTDGFYYTDGFQLIKISLDLNKSYQQATQSEHQKKRVVGAYDKLTRRIWWSMQTQPTDSDVNMNYIYYLDYGVKPSGVYTTASNSGALVPAVGSASYSGAGNPNNYNYWQPSAMVFYQGQLVRGDPRGVLFKTDPNTTTDPKIDLTQAAYTFASGVPTQNWGTVPIPFNWTTTAMDMGTHVKRKYATKTNWMGKNVGNAQIQVNAISDNGRITTSMAPINYNPNPLWGDARVSWGATANAACKWSYQGDADFWRRFPATSLRANLRQIQFTNAFMGVYRSEDFPPGGVATTAPITPSAGFGQVTLPTVPTYGALVWPLDCVDYFIAFASDGYVQTWQILSVSTNTLVVLDSGNTIGTQSGVPWVIRGYKKNQAVEVSAAVIRYAVFGDKTQAWQSKADSGENT